MGRYLVYRLLSAIPILLIVSLASFLIIFLVPGDPASEIAGPGATSDEVARIRQSLGLDPHVDIQMLACYRRLLQGDLGHSIMLHRSVTTAIIERAPVTLSLTCLALAHLARTGARPRRRGRGQAEHLGRPVGDDGGAAGALPARLLGRPGHDLHFAVMLGWFPTGGYVELSKGVGPWLRSLMMPAAALGITQLGLFARITRAAMLEVLKQDYVRTARAKGLPERHVVGRHALANALIPVVTVIGLTVGILLGGAVVVE